MGNSLRCCLACILPCGALDVIRIVHLNGQVEEYSRQVSASEILAANPNHVLSQPYCHSDHVVHRIMIVSPESELKRGNIYFLIPSSSLPDKKKKKKKKKTTKKFKSSKQTKASSVIASEPERVERPEEIISDEKSSHHRRRCGRVTVWRPHLDSIAEDS